MAVNKAKRSIHLAQPERRSNHPSPAELMPVKTHVYRAIAELNQGFEKVLNDLNTLGKISFFRSGAVSSVHRTLARLRAELNQEFTITLHGRETANAGYFERLGVNEDAADGEPAEIRPAG